MAKLQRKSAKLFAEEATASAGGLAQFGSLAEGTPNYSTDPDVIQALDAYKEGWSSAVLGTKSPALEDRNALDYLLSYQQKYNCGLEILRLLILQFASDLRLLPF